MLKRIVLVSIALFEMLYIWYLLEELSIARFDTMMKAYHEINAFNR